MQTLLLSTFLAAASAAPPSSQLDGAAGGLSWTVDATSAAVAIDGRSPKWTVHHDARADLSPVRTERTDADGALYVVDYDATGATVTGPDGRLRIDRPGLWDADTVDIRLGQLVADGDREVRFDAIDLSGPKVYGFRAEVVEDTQCGAVACKKVELQLSGVLRLVGPTWTYWFADDGALLAFDGPAGTFHATAFQPSAFQPSAFQPSAFQPSAFAGGAR